MEFHTDGRIHSDREIIIDNVVRHRKVHLRSGLQRSLHVRLGSRRRHCRRRRRRRHCSRRQTICTLRLGHVHHRTVGRRQTIRVGRLHAQQNTRIGERFAFHQLRHIGRRSQLHDVLLLDHRRVRWIIRPAANAGVATIAGRPMQPFVLVVRCVGQRGQHRSGHDTADVLLGDLLVALLR